MEWPVRHSANGVSPGPASQRNSETVIVGVVSSVVAFIRDI